MLDPYRIERAHEVSFILNLVHGAECSDRSLPRLFFLSEAERGDEVVAISENGKQFGRLAMPQND
jgi:hypothetical protein